MKFLRKLSKFLWLFFFAFMLAVCIFIGVAPIIPKRKEEFSIEVKMEQPQEENNTAYNNAQTQEKN